MSQEAETAIIVIMSLIALTWPGIIRKTPVLLNKSSYSYLIIA